MIEDVFENVFISKDLAPAPLPYFPGWNIQLCNLIIDGGNKAIPIYYSARMNMFMGIMDDITFVSYAMPPLIELLRRYVHTKEIYLNHRRENKTDWIYVRQSPVEAVAEKNAAIYDKCLYCVGVSPGGYSVAALSNGIIASVVHFLEGEK